MSPILQKDTITSRKTSSNNRSCQTGATRRKLGRRFREKSNSGRARLRASLREIQTPGIRRTAGASRRSKKCSSSSQRNSTMWKLINGPPSLPSLFHGTALLSRKCNSGASSRNLFSKRRHSSKSKRKQSTSNIKKISATGEFSLNQLKDSQLYSPKIPNDRSVWQRSSTSRRRSQSKNPDRLK